MSDKTLLLASKTEKEAGNAMKRWKARGFNVAVAGPTDAIELFNADDHKTWESGSESDWFIVLATKSALEIVANEKAENDAGGSA